MATITITTTTEDDVRIKAVNEHRGFTGTNAQHRQEIKRQLLRFLNQYVLSGEADIEESARTSIDLGAI